MRVREIGEDKRRVEGWLHLTPNVQAQRLPKAVRWSAGLGVNLRRRLMPLVTLSKGTNGSRAGGNFLCSLSFKRAEL